MKLYNVDFDLEGHLHFWTGSAYFAFKTVPKWSSQATWLLVCWVLHSISWVAQGA